MNIYAGNLSREVTEEDLRQLLRPSGRSPRSVLSGTSSLVCREDSDSWRCPRKLTPSRQSTA